MKNLINNSFKKFCLIMLILLFSMPLMACQKIENINLVSKNLSSYNMDIDYNHDEKSLCVKQKTHYKNNTKQILKKIKFHLYPTAFCADAMNKPVSTTSQTKAYYNGINYAEFNMKVVKSENFEIIHSYEGNDNNILVIELSKTLLPQKSIELYFEFDLTLPNINHRMGWGENCVNVANFYPIACVYKDGDFCCEPYSHNGDPFFSDMSNYNVNIKYNKDLILASTGEQKTIEENGFKITNITAKTVRDFAFVLSDKFTIVEKKWQDINIKYYYYEDDNFEANLNCAVNAIKTFSKLFCAYPYKTYSVVKTNFVHGGMEFPNMVMISDEVENVNDYYNVIVHETAHQWWYNLVGNDAYNDPWLDESLTEYSTILFYDYNEGYEYNHNDMIDTCYSNYVFFLSIYNDILGNVDTSMNRSLNEYNTDPEYTYMAYVKGVLMYDSLYKIVGKNKFLKSLSAYATENCYQNVTSKNLIECFEKTCNVDLNNFFECWLEGKVIVN